MAQTISVKLDPEIRARMEALARARQRTPHWMMRQAVEQFLDREERREAFKRQAIAAWTAYERTGLHACAEEVNAWLDRLEAGEDVEPPECHE